MNKIAPLAAALWALGTSAYASEASFNDAVNLYLKGYADCREANLLRTDDIKAARQLFDNYLKILDQAAAIDPGILKSTERDMDANLTYCERVNTNLKMAEAAPVLEDGFSHCHTAKTALEGNDLDTAQAELDAFAQKRDAALAITPGIMEVYSLASQVRACGRLEEKFAEARQARENEAQAIATLQQQVASYQQKCQTALSFTRKNTFTIATIDQANQLLAAAQQARKQASSNAPGRKALASNATLQSQLKQQEDAAGRCEAEVSGLIRNMSQQRDLAVRTLETAIADLTSANNQCRKGQQLLEQGTPAAREEASRLIRDINTLIGKGSTAALAAMAKRHAGWPQSKAWSERNTQATQCRQALQASLASAKPVANAASTPKAASPAGSSAAPSNTTATRQQPAEKPSSPVQAIPTNAASEAVVKGPKSASATERAREQAPTDAREPGSPAPANDSIKVGKGDWTELVDETAESTEPAAPDEAASKNPLRKSWTDLVQ